MPTFTPMSASRLATCHEDLQMIMNAAILKADFVVLCGHRGEADQAAAYAAGTSKEKWPLSRHNSSPSSAVDIAPLPIDWHDLGRFRALSAIVRQCAVDLGIPLEWGGEWHSFTDYPHYQLPHGYVTGIP